MVVQRCIHPRWPAVVIELVVQHSPVEHHHLSLAKVKLVHLATVLFSKAHRKLTVEHQRDFTSTWVDVW